MVTTDSAVVNIQEAAGRLSENMLAMQSSFLFRGYFKRKAKEEAAAGDTTATDELDMDEDELEEIIKEAQKELDAKRKKKEN
jgi:phospholipid/cholesterol/gamma-HCH transport system substrate-binding protein